MKAEERLKLLYGTKAKTVKIPLLHGKSVNAYIKKIEDGHKKAAESKLNFR